MPRLRAVSISPPQAFWTFEFSGRSMEVFGPLYAVAMVEEKGEESIWYFVTMGERDGQHTFERDNCYRSRELARQAAQEYGENIASKWRESGRADISDFPVVVREIHE